MHCHQAFGLQQVQVGYQGLCRQKKTMKIPKRLHYPNAQTWSRIVDSAIRSENMTMSAHVWEFHGMEYGNCNCAYGCPCQFNALPTDNTCRAFGAVKIDSGYYGDTRLEGLIFGYSIDFPNPIHEGNGTHQVFIDEAATEPQRQALLKIVRGEDTEPMATHYAVYAMMSSTHLEPVYLPMTLELDMASASAQAKVGSIIESRCEPIRNPITNAEHRAQIHLPHGFEYRIAEMCSGSTLSRGDIPLDLKASYSHIHEVHMCNSGVIEH
jgi:hypothetical protein